MAEKIKRIKSLPIFLIFCLITSTIAAVVFNLNINWNFQRGEQVIQLSRVVEAQNDTATTTVTVRNAPPAFTVDPAEVPASSSTNPTNVGDVLVFTATADDPEDNSYYLIVCDSDGVSPGAGGGVPSCTGTTFCVSSLTADTAQATCNYTVGSIAAEQDDWFAFVCDNHATEADCSSSNQGTGVSGSPYYINHAPVLTSATTTVNNQEPGGTFTIQANVTDSDVLGGADVLEMHVCSTNSWATSTGCAATTLCTGTSTSPNVSCQYTDTAPTPDQDYTYYVFVKDTHPLGAHQMPASGNPATSTYTIINVAPQVSNITLNNGSNIQLNIKGAPDVTVYATSTSVVDQNGCADITSATGTIYWNAVTGGYNCAADDNNCYPIAAVNCVQNSCAGAVASYTCSASLKYYALPTDSTAGNPYAADGWIAAIRAFDEALSGVGTSSPVDVISSAALEVTETQIPYGTIQAGLDTGDANATTTVLNYGNTPLDSDITGTDMLKNGTGPDSIPANQQEFATSTFTYGSGTFTLSSTSTVTVDIEVARPTSTTDISDQIFWGIAIPAGTPSGDYYGSNTFSAATDPNGNWN